MTIGQAVKHRYDKVRGTVIARDPKTGMLLVRFEDGVEDWCEPADLIASRSRKVA